MHVTNQESMWGKLAHYYDIIYANKPYQQEADTIHQLIQKHKQSPGSEMLDIACGTANHIQYLTQYYTITGIDKSPQMLTIAKNKFPQLIFHQADMISFDLNKQFDVITCLFSSIGYVKTYANLNKTIASCTKHLKPGGVLIIEPFFTEQAYTPGTSHATYINQPDIKLCRMHHNQKQGKLAILDFHFLVATDRGVEYLCDQHELAIFETDKFLDILTTNGLHASYLPDKLVPGKGLYIGTKQ